MSDTSALAYFGAQYLCDYQKKVEWLLKAMKVIMVMIPGQHHGCSQHSGTDSQLNALMSTDNAPIVFMVKYG